MDVRDLQTGDEIVAYMRSGLALEVGRKPDGSGYRTVPLKPKRAAAGDITRFRGSVVANDSVDWIITVTTVAINHKGVPRSRSPSLIASISYTALKQVFLVSAIAQEAREEIRRGGNEFRPTTAALGTNYKHYHTLEQVLIPR